MSPPNSMIAGTRIGCNAGKTGGFTYEVGQPNPGKTIENGKGADVSCTVRQDGNFTASIGGTDTNGGQYVSFTFDGVINDPNAANNPATMTFFSPDTLHLNTLTGFPGCTVSKVAVFKKGAMLADIDCPIIGDDTDASSGCKVHGTFAVEYCKTGDEQN